MNWVRVVVLRLIGLFRKGRLERDLDEELRSHLEMQFEENLRKGMSPQEARYAALRSFGGVEQVKEIYRGQRGLPMIETLLQDMRYGMRQLRRNPEFALTVVLTLALGIGANTAIFSVVYAVLLKQLPYYEPEQLFSVEVVIPERQDHIPSLPVRVQDYLEWRKADTVFSAVAALRPAEWNLTETGEPERIGGARVSAGFFSFLGIPIARGRGFSSEEEQPGRDRVVVISEALWRRRYGSDPALVGRSIMLNGEGHLVVGIAPSSLLVPTGTQLYAALAFAPRIDVWKPLAPSNSELQGEDWNHGLLVRLKPGESAERGREQLQTMLNRSLRAQVPELKTEFITRLVPIREIYAGKIRLRLLLVLGAAALLLLGACTNIANLFLARVASRAGEFATRSALGAGRARIVSQMLTESTLLATIGGAVSTVIAYGLVRVLLSHGPGDVQLFAETRLNLPVLFFATAATLVTGLTCGVFPAWQAYRKDAGIGLREGARASFGGSRAVRFRQVLVGFETALCTALLACAGLLLHSFVNVVRADRGYEVEHVLAVDLALSGQRYATGQQRTSFYRELTAGIRVLPGVSAAGAISDLPAVGQSGTQTIFYATDTDFQSAVMQRPVAGFRNATPGYFAASGGALQAGRFFSEQDQIPVAVISESLAQRLWPGEALTSIVGRAVRQGDVTGPLITVVGIVEDVRPGAVEQELPPQIYRLHHQSASGRMTVVVRAFQEPTAVAGALRAEIKKLDSNLPVSALRTMREIVSTSVAQRRFQMVLTSLFAVLAVLLAAVGIYGVVSYSIACRTRDIGLRIALGAQRRDIMRWVFAKGSQPVLIGLLIGLGGAVMIAQALRKLLFGIAPDDPVALAGVALVLLSTAGLACYFPARRASRVDPMVALRHE